MQLHYLLIGKSNRPRIPYRLALTSCLVWCLGVSAQVPLRYSHTATPLSMGTPHLAETNYPVSLRQIGGSRWVTPMLTIKTNVTELATTTLNVGVEQFIGNRLSVSIPVSYNPWTFNDNKKIKHLAIQPEFRVWFGETFAGSFINVQSFIGLQLHYLYYNVGGIKLPFGMFPDPASTVSDFAFSVGQLNRQMYVSPFRFHNNGEDPNWTVGNASGTFGAAIAKLQPTVTANYLAVHNYNVDGA